MKKLIKKHRGKVITFAVLVGMVLYVKGWQSDNTIPIGKDAVVITGECVVINYDASEETWDKAKAAWLEALKEHPRKGTGHTKAYY